MTWIARSLPAERDEDPPPPPPRPSPALAAAARLTLARIERAELAGQLRPRIRTERQVRIRRRIAELTREILCLEIHSTPEG